MYRFQSFIYCFICLASYFLRTYHSSTWTYPPHSNLTMSLPTLSIVGEKSIFPCPKLMVRFWKNHLISLDLSLHILKWENNNDGKYQLHQTIVWIPVNCSNILKHTIYRCKYYLRQEFRFLSPTPLIQTLNASFLNMHHRLEKVFF